MPERRLQKTREAYRERPTRDDVLFGLRGLKANLVGTRENTGLLFVTPEAQWPDPIDITTPFRKSR